jgi:mannose-6-phosphate isomerase-like protein (cupin superfamily)
MVSTSRVPDLGRQDRQATAIVIERSTRMPKYVFHEHELETYIPPGHSGVVNVRLVSKSQVADHFEMVLGQADSGGSAEPHSHEHSHQVYYILQGQGRVKIGEDPPVDFGPGSVIVIPPGIIHSVWAVGEERARVIVIYSPPLESGGSKSAVTAER